MKVKLVFGDRREVTLEADSVSVGGGAVTLAAGVPPAPLEEQEYPYSELLEVRILNLSAGVEAVPEPAPEPEPEAEPEKEPEEV